MSDKILSSLLDGTDFSPLAVAHFRRFVIQRAVEGDLCNVEGGWMREVLPSCLEPLNDGKLLHQGWSPQCLSEPANGVDEWAVLKTTAIQDGQFLEAHNKLLPQQLAPKQSLEVKAGDILITCAGPRARCGVPCLVRETRSHLMISGKMYRFRADPNKLDPDYLLLILRSPSVQKFIDSIKTGASESGLNLTQARFKSLHITYPASLEEQRKIVALNNELLVLCDRWEAACLDLEARRKQFVVACCATAISSAQGIGGADEALRVLLDEFPNFTAVRADLTHLKQTVLELAMRGKLVKQIHGEGSAEDFGSQFFSMRSSSVEFGSHGFEASATHEIPYSWKWTTLDKLIIDGPQNGLSPPKTDREDAPKALTLTATTSGSFEPSHFKRVDALLDADSEFWLKPNDLLFQRGNAREYVGMAAIYDGPENEFIFPDLMIRVRLHPDFNLRYIHFACISPSSRLYFERNATGAQKTMPKINQKILKSLPIAIPPSHEQERIVNKLDELFGIVDRLGEALEASADLKESAWQSLPN